jgi:23S rRNA (guanine2535-N1)-methyltransferase
MPYLFATQDLDYSDFASGRVIYNLAGFPAFPVRLASEIFLRALKRLREHIPKEQRLTLYDPTCGGAYYLTALGMLHGQDIGLILASDIEERAVILARRNLELLSATGLDRREHEIREMLKKYGKESHTAALESLHVLRERVLAAPPIRTSIFQADALATPEIAKGLASEMVHLVVSDIPYGMLSAWYSSAGADPSHSPLWRMLTALHPVLSPGSIVAIAADKSQKITHEAYQRVERFQVGKRQVFLSKRLA